MQSSSRIQCRRLILFVICLCGLTLCVPFQLQRERPTTFLIGVFSTTGEGKHRAEIRKSIFEHRNGRVCNLQQYVKRRNTRKVCQILYTFVIGASPSAPSLVLSNSTYPVVLEMQGGEPDVTWLSIRENMQDGKTQTWFSFAASLTSQYSIDYIAKMDMDTFLDVRSLLKFIDANLPPAPSAPTTDTRKRYGGLLQEFLACGRYVHCELLRGRIYMSGQFYFVSGDLASYISSNVFDSSKLRTGFEDIDFGLWIFSYPAAINLVVMSGEMVWVHDFYLTKTESGWAQVKERISSGQILLPSRRDMLRETDSCIRSSDPKRCGQNYSEKHT